MACSLSFAVAEVDDDHRSSQGRHRFPKSLLLTKKSYPKKSGKIIQRQSPLSTQSISLASLLKPSDDKEGVFNKHYNTPDRFREGMETRDVDESSIDGGNFNGRETAEEPETSNRFSSHYNTPDSFRAGAETRDEVYDKKTDNATPNQVTGRYSTPYGFGEEFGSWGVNMAEKQGFVPPGDIFEDLSDDNEVPDDSSAIVLGLSDDVIVPADETVPDEFQGQENGKVSSRLNPEVGELGGMYYRTDKGLARLPPIEVLAEDYNQKYAADSGGKAYTEGGLIYLPKKPRGKNRFRRS